MVVFDCILWVLEVCDGMQRLVGVSYCVPCIGDVHNSLLPQLSVFYPCTVYMRARFFFRAFTTCIYDICVLQTVNCVALQQSNVLERRLSLFLRILPTRQSNNQCTMIVEPVMLMCSEWMGVWVHANNRP